MQPKYGVQVWSLSMESKYGVQVWTGKLFTGCLDHTLMSLRDAALAALVSGLIEALHYGNGNVEHRK